MTAPDPDPRPASASGGAAEPTRRYALRPAALEGAVDATLRARLARELNEEQLAAVLAPGGPMLILAGAGSGKTRVLTYRVAALLQRGVPARAILLLTFTNKAARQMLERVEAVAGVGRHELWGGTFHHVANRILRRHAPELGLPERFSILDREDATELLATVIGEQAAPIDAASLPPKAPVLLAAISLAANTMQPLELVLAERFSALAPQAERILTLAAQYQARKLAMGAVDFDDLLLLLHRLLDDPDLRAHWAGRFAHVLVDEYQDTNRLQGELVDRLASVHRNLCVVGDDAQAIYSFRGADDANILGFTARYPDAQVLRLTCNYRSLRPILDLANAAIAHNARQYPKELRPARGEAGPAPVVAAALDGQQQAQFVAQRVLELATDEGLALAEIAILYRAHYQSMELQVELGRRGVPYVVRSGLRFFETAHIKDVLAYLRLVANPADELSWRRVLQQQPGIGRASAGRVWEQVRQRVAAGQDLAALLPALADTPRLSARAREGVRQLAAELSSLSRPAPGLVSDGHGTPGHPAGAPDLPPDASARAAPRPAPAQDLTRPPGELIMDILRVYAPYLLASFTDAPQRADDIRQLAQLASRYASADEMLAEIALLSDVEGSGAGDPDEPPQDQLCLSTVHQAKGLEWRAVFVLWLCEGKFPIQAAIAEGSEEEERRLFYVACTRAKDQLYLSYPISQLGHDYTQTLQRPSRFIAELDGAAPPLFERWTLTQELASHGPEEPPAQLPTSTPVGLHLDRSEADPLPELHERVFRR